MSYDFNNSITHFHNIKLVSYLNGSLRYLNLNPNTATNTIIHTRYPSPSPSMTFPSSVSNSGTTPKNGNVWKITELCVSKSIAFQLQTDPEILDEENSKQIFCDVTNFPYLQQNQVWLGLPQAMASQHVHPGMKIKKNRSIWTRAHLAFWLTRVVIHLEWGAIGQPCTYFIYMVYDKCHLQ